MKRSPYGSYLLHKPYGYLFRVTVPLDIRHFICRTEIRYSLRTGELRLAKARASRIASFVHKVFARVRSGGSMTELSEQEIKKLIGDYVDRVLKDDEESRILGTNRGGHAEAHREEHSFFCRVTWQVQNHACQTVVPTC